MAPSHSKPLTDGSKNKKSKLNPLFDHPINQLQRGDLLWDDDFVHDMAEGKKPKQSSDWAKITKPNAAKKPSPVKTFSESIEKKMCPSMIPETRSYFLIRQHGTRTVKMLNITISSVRELTLALVRFALTKTM